MSNQLLKVVLQSWTDKWDDLTELLEDLGPYTSAPTAELYPVIQAIAEGKSTEMKVYKNQLKDFIAHMREFKIEVKEA